MINFSFSEIDFQRIGTWPIYVKIAIVIGMCAIIAMACDWLFISSKAAHLEELQAEEVRLKQFFVTKQNSLIDIQDYKKQMTEIERRLAKLVEKLPGDNELPNLINQISQAGQDSGLAINEIKILPEKKFKYYVELPINIQVEGEYAQIGNFISSVSGMSRVITFHDFNLQHIASAKDESDTRLKMEILAKTYRYVAPKEDEESDDETNKIPETAPGTTPSEVPASGATDTPKAET